MWLSWIVWIDKQDEHFDDKSVEHLDVKLYEQLNEWLKEQYTHELWTIKVTLRLSIRKRFTIWTSWYI